MSTSIVTVCPRCGEKMEKGFAHRTLGLSFVEPEKLKQFFSIDEDLTRVGTLRKIFPSKAEYFDSCLCRACELYIIDFSTTLDRAAIEKRESV